MAQGKMTSKMQKALTTWTECNNFLRTATEDEAFTLLQQERAGKKRTQYLLRFHSRFNHERAKRERNEIFADEE